ncbi:MAG: hypothetical protein FWB85_06555 [Chitinispirillia bacterium]|nr:hypothetical protein [Chitinispirillia bacterium]MCL2241883.1 hypothetical protein [Chitinispirillia bacterium]
MSFTKFDLEKVLIIKYNQETVTDLDNLRTEIMAEASAGTARDTVLEFTGGAVMYSNEIGIIVQYLKALPGTGRTLHLVASNYVCEMLKTINIHRIPGLMLHNSLDEVQGYVQGVDLGSL